MNIFTKVLRDLTGAERRDAEAARTYLQAELTRLKADLATAEAAAAHALDGFKLSARATATTALAKAKADAALAVKDASPEVKTAVDAALALLEKNIFSLLA